MEMNEKLMEDYEKKLKDKSPLIVFKQISEGYVKIFREGKEIGHIFSNGNDENGHNFDSYSGKQSIQLCGFDEVAGEWGCGCYKGKRDLCVRFYMTPEQCETTGHTFVEIGRASREYSGEKSYIVKKCWHCGKLIVE